jgi:hypothetical protein
MSVTALLLILAGQQAATTTTKPPPEAQGQQTIVVTGERPDPRQKEAEEPYSTIEHTPLGSRIPRKMGPRTFSTVATNTGLAGLLLGGGVGGGANSMDGTGGSVVRFRNRIVKVCKADREEVSEETACALVEAKKKMAQGDHAAASAALAPLLANRTLNSFDRYYIGYFAYQLADAQRDDAAREKALGLMLSSKRMPEGERLGAMKTMVRLSLKRGDEAAAKAMLEKLLALQPGDAASQANLATLYAWQGQHEKALPLMRTAVNLIQKDGGTPPKDWTDYLSRQQPSQTN